MVKELKAYRIEWFSGTGKGGQYRNRHMNCCRVIHEPTGITAQGTGSRSRQQNLKSALAVCRARVAANQERQKERYQAGHERIRTYHEPDDRVTEHRSGIMVSYREVMEGKGLERLLEASIMRALRAC